MDKSIQVMVYLVLGGVILSGCSKVPGKDTKQVCFEKECVDVEVVWTQEDTRKGLQNRAHLEDNQGMLFLFEEEKQHRFWMKDTLIPLDIIWIDRYREVVNMAVFVPPCKEERCPDYRPNESAKYVLEVNAGKAEKMGFIPGDRLKFK